MLRQEFPEQPIVGVGAVILQNESIVLVKRAAEPGKGKWSIPGGVVNLGEKVRDAVIREAKEECSLKIELLLNRPLDVVDMMVKDDIGRLKYHYVLLQFLSKPESGTLAASSDASDALWAALDAVEEYELTDSFRSFFKEHRDELRSFQPVL